MCSLLWVWGPIKREDVSMRYSWQEGSLTAWAGSIPALPPAGRRKKIKLVLKEGHLARETKGLRNPLLWGTFKWGEIPTQASTLCGCNMHSHSPLLVPSSFTSRIFPCLFPTR